MRLAKAHQPPVPVLAMSASEERRFLARELGADGTITNPPQFPELQTTILRLLGKPKSTALK
jgi:DNA-binding response OmpR family regulator